MSKLSLEEKETGIHRAKTWEIALYALNNTSTNTYMMLVAAISYYLVGIVGIGAVLAGSFVTIMRIWDGVTDPLVGMILDNTNTKFGKNRPFIVIGQVILFVTTLIMFRVVPNTPTSMRFVMFTIIYCLYILGYTAQCIVTKSAQTCLTNDPKQRPVFSMFDAVYNTLLMSLFVPIYQSGYIIPKYTLSMAEHADQIQALITKSPHIANLLVEKDGMTTLSGFYNPAMWQEMQITFALISAVFAACAIFALRRKDNAKYFGTGKAQKVSMRDYVDVLAHNRGIQMLIVAASSDKLALQCTTNSTVLVALFGVICGNYALSGSNSAITAIPVVIFSVLGMNYIARRLGQKKCLIVGTWGALAAAAAIACLLIFGAPSTMKLPAFVLTKPATWVSLFTPSSWSFAGLAFVVLYILMKGFSNLSGSIVIPMTADCADYEVYRSGRYVPGLMGTLFSFVDKLISSLGATIVALVFAAVGFRTSLPTPDSPYSTGILVAVLICYLGMPAIGWILNVVAMKFYPLTKERMAEIQDEIAKIKAEASNV